MADNNSMKLQEGVRVSQAEIKSEGQIKRTTAAATALLALALYAGSPTPAKAETPTENKAVATFVVNAEYEAIIAEAKKQGKNPVEVAMVMKQDGKYTFAQFRAFSKYYGAKLEAEEGKIDQAAIEVKSKIDSTIEQINAKAMGNLRLIAGIYSNDADIFNKKPEWKAFIYEVYVNQQKHYKAETVQYVAMHFPKIIQHGATIAMNNN